MLAINSYVSLTFNSQVSILFSFRHQRSSAINFYVSLFVSFPFNSHVSILFSFRHQRSSAIALSIRQLVQAQRPQRFGSDGEPCPGRPCHDPHVQRRSPFARTAAAAAASAVAGPIRPTCLLLQAGAEMGQGRGCHGGWRTPARRRGRVCGTLTVSLLKMICIFLPVIALF